MGKKRKGLYLLKKAEKQKFLEIVKSVINCDKLKNKKVRFLGLWKKANNKKEK